MERKKWANGDRKGMCSRNCGYIPDDWFNAITPYFECDADSSFGVLSSAKHRPSGASQLSSIPLYHGLSPWSCRHKLSIAADTVNVPDSDPVSFVAHGTSDQSQTVAEYRT